MTSELPKVGSVWGVVGDVRTWRKFCGVDDDRGYKWETWNGMFFETALRIEPHEVDIRAIVSDGESPDLATIVSQQYESGKASAYEAELSRCAATDLSQPFTVDWLCEIGGSRRLNGRDEYIVFEDSTGVHFSYNVTFDQWSYRRRLCPKQPKTRGDVLKLLDVLGIVPATTKGGDK